MADDRNTERGSRVSTERFIAFRIAAFLFGAAALGGLFGIGLVIGWFDADEGGIHRVHDIGFGILYGVVVAAAFFVLLARPTGMPSVLLQVVAVALGVAVGALIAADLPYLVIAAGLLIAVTIMLVVDPARREFTRLTTDPSLPLLLGVAVGAVPLVWFGLATARLQRLGPPSDPHVSMSHWTTMASVAFGLLAVGLLSSLRIRGWRVTAWCAGLAVAIYGIASIVFAHFPGSGLPYAGSEGVGWGTIATLGGLGFVALAEWEVHRAHRAG